MAARVGLFVITTGKQAHVDGGRVFVCRCRQLEQLVSGGSSWQSWVVVLKSPGKMEEKYHRGFAPRQLAERIGDGSGMCRLGKRLNVGGGKFGFDAGRARIAHFFKPQQRCRTPSD